MMKMSERGWENRKRREGSLEERESFIFSFPSLIIFVEKKQKDGEKEIERLQIIERGNRHPHLRVQERCFRISKGYPKIYKPTNKKIIFNVNNNNNIN